MIYDIDIKIADFDLVAKSVAKNEIKITATELEQTKSVVTDNRTACEIVRDFMSFDAPGPQFIKYFPEFC
jgi:hypothetical protein